LLGSLWFNSFSAGGGGAAADYELISTTVLSSSAASVTFSGLGTSAAAYKHLQIRAVVRASGNSIFSRYNSDSTSGNYRSHGLQGNGSSVLFEDYTYARDKGMIGGFMGLDATIPFALISDILDFQNTSKYKTARTLSGRATGGVALDSHVWMSTAAITSVTVLTGAASFTVGDRFSLYGLK